MTERFTIRRLDINSEASRPARLPSTLVKLQVRLSQFEGPYPVYADGIKVGVRFSATSARKLVARLLREKKVNRVVISTGGSAKFAVKRLPPIDTPDPVIDTEGTAQIDKIYTAVHRQFDGKWTVRDMGIYVNKPGEHGRGNAWDAGTDPGAPAETQHARILAMATWLRDEAVAGRLPVYGIIVLDKFWRTGMGKTWAEYTGTKHVSHFHVSGYPSLTGWV